MTQFSYPDALAVWRLVYFTFALISSLVVSWRHGFGKNSGWIYLAIFCVIRIINSNAQLATLSPSNTEAATIAAVTSFLGLSPLLLAALGLLSRIYYEILRTPWNFIFSFVILKAVQTPAGIALVLCIVGATSADTVEDVNKQATVKAGVVIYLVVYIALVLLTAIAALASRKTCRGERTLLTAVGISLPVLLIRVVYSLLSTFSGMETFSPIDGSTTAELCLAFLEEMVVVLIYIWAGLALRVVTDVENGASTKSRMLHRAGRGDFGVGKLGLLSLGAAVMDRSFHHGQKDESA